MNAIKLTPIQNTIFTAIYEDKIEGETIHFYEIIFCKNSFFLKDDINELINNNLIKVKDNRLYPTEKGKKLFDDLHQIVTFPDKYLKNEQEDFLFKIIKSDEPIVLNILSFNKYLKIIKKLEKKGYIRKYRLIENEVITLNYKIYPTLRRQLYAEAVLS